MACSIAIRLAFSVLAIGAAGCASPSPTSPDAVTPVVPPQTFTVSGTVLANSGAGLVPVAGVLLEAGDMRVYVGGLPRLATTDEKGFFAASGLSGRLSMRAVKFGYEIGVVTATIAGDTRLDIQLVPRPTFALSGVVFETVAGQIGPIDGADVYCDYCGDGGHSWVITDSQGRYTFPAVYNGYMPIIIGKPGYAVVGSRQTLSDGSGIRDAFVNGDTRFDVEMVRR